MATKYISALTGQEMDSALTDMAYHNSEAYAVGTRNGIPVDSSDVTYHNNSKYWAEQVYGYTDRAEDAAARAEAAVPASTSGAVFFSTAQSLTNAQKMQAKSNIGAGGNNPNHIDNPFFTINQRGQSSYTSTGYCLDRWKWQSGTGEIQTSLEGIYVGNPSSIRLRQEIPFSTYETLLDKPVTLSAILNDTVYSVSGTIPSTWVTADTTLVSQTTDDYRLQIVLLASGRIRVELFIYTAMTVKAVKLEFASYSTIANDAPPNYAEELAKCQMYCRVFNPTNGYFYLGGMCNSTTQFRSYALPPMAAAGRTSGSPTVTLTGSAQLYLVDGTNVAVTSVTSAWLPIADGGVTVFANVAGGLTAYTPATLRIDQGSMLIVSCDF